MIISNKIWILLAIIILSISIAIIFLTFGLRNVNEYSKERDELISQQLHEVRAEQIRLNTVLAQYMKE